MGSLKGTKLVVLTLLAICNRAAASSNAPDVAAVHLVFARVLQADSSPEAVGTEGHDAPVEDASHQQALQHGTGGVEVERKLQRQLGQRFENPPSPPETLTNAKQSPVQSELVSAGPAIIKAEITPGIVMVLTLLMAGASALGAAPYFFVQQFSKEYSALASAVACGVMLAASFDLVHEGQPYGANLVILGVLTGAIFIQLTQQQLDKFGDVKFESLSGANARKTVLVVGIMAAHAVGEGCGVGVSFCGTRGWAQGILVTLAIGLHNIPEGLAVATVLVSRGVVAKRAAWWALATALPQPLLAVPSFMFVDTFTSLLPLALGFAAGCMTWMVFAELIPDALADAPHGKVATTATFSACGLEALRMMLADLEQPGGTLSNPFQAPLHLLMPIAIQLLPIGLPAGAIGGLLAHHSIKPRPGLIGLAAGILIILSASALGTQIIWDSSIAATSILACSCSGGFALWLLWRQKAKSAEHNAKQAKLDSPADVEAQTDTGLDKAKTSAEGFGIMSARAGSWQLETADERRHVHTNGFETPLKDVQNSVLAYSRPGRPVSASKTNKQSTAPPYSTTSASSGLSMLAGFLSVTALSLHSMCEGWTAALAVFNGVSVSTIALPLYLTGMLKAAAGTILAGLLYRQTARRAVAAGFAIAVLTPLAALLALARAPLSDLTPQYVLDAPGLTSKLTAAAAGAMLVLGVQVLTPMAIRLHQQAALKGLLAGLTGSSLVFGLRGVLCGLFSYCAYTK